MKNPLGTRNLLLLAVGIISSVTALASAQPRKHVLVGKDAAYIPPMTHISDSDQQEMDKVLEKYDKSLYRIHAYKGGKPNRIWGKGCPELAALAKRTDAEAKEKGLSDCAFQIGSSRRLAGVTNVSCNVPTPAEATKLERLIKELKPILEKYK